ncbi:hypothetical protein LAZ67_14000247 [Cordylochernes scorpioides]|uniref:Uncharacterized protein n=1 Tax=Cordylochernes scorpioides TaxID=51811 RepID=A0ABY6L5F4_9ARAC|nr:hypothetical protein LAZ67_14000247 [Cordylochernes scorpioides]
MSAAWPPKEQRRRDENARLVEGTSTTGAQRRRYREMGTAARRGRSNMRSAEREKENPKIYFFFSNMMTGDKTWVYLYDPETKVQSLEWNHSSSSKKIKFKVQRSSKELMATVFWDMRGVILINFQEKSLLVAPTT